MIISVQFKRKDGEYGGLQYSYLCDVPGVQPGDLVFVLSPKGATSGDSRDIIAKLQNVNADVVVVTDDASEAPAGTTPVVLPATGCEFTFPQIAVMFFQLLACCMTIIRGIDPDMAGVINKITITK